MEFNYYAKPVSEKPIGEPQWVVIEERFENGHKTSETQKLFPPSSGLFAEMVALTLNHEAMNCGDHIAQHSDGNGEPYQTEAVA